MLQDGLRKVLTGDTTIDEILRLVQLDDDSMNSYEQLGIGSQKNESETTKPDEPETNFEPTPAQIQEVQPVATDNATTQNEKGIEEFTF